MIKHAFMKLVSLILVFCALGGCELVKVNTTDTTASPTASPTASASEETLSDAQQMAQDYTGLDEDNVFYIGDHDSLTKMLAHGTGIVLLGFPECPWCQAYVPQLNDAVKSAGTQVMYYNIHVDKTEDTAFYQQVAETINAWDDSIIQYDNDGNMRIYMPLVLFVSNGELIGYDNETCMEDSDVISPEDYWTADKKAALSEKLTGLATQIADLQAANDSSGCDTGCAYTPAAQ
ncbi:MAG: thioredoxin family protein [Solobacterium sp.]|jgi:thiol-disulfide isomerase/thioredoxin|nr:thioredoxin family protein [Solobacterium sp.]MCH4265847.1 thioredoxin family protein [Solobacterium sp.]